MPITPSFTANENISTDFTSSWAEMLISCLPPPYPLHPSLSTLSKRDCGPRGVSQISQVLDGHTCLTMCYLQLGKGGMVPASGLSHINGLAGFGPGVLNPAGKAHPLQCSLVRNGGRVGCKTFRENTITPSHPPLQNL